LNLMEQPLFRQRKMWKGLVVIVIVKMESVAEEEIVCACQMLVMVEVKLCC